MPDTPTTAHPTRAPTPDEADALMATVLALAKARKALAKAQKDARKAEKDALDVRDDVLRATGETTLYELFAGDERMLEELRRNHFIDAGLAALKLTDRSFILPGVGVVRYADATVDQLRAMHDRLERRR
jgi:hypothetical protein